MPIEQKDESNSIQYNFIKKIKIKKIKQEKTKY